MSDCKELDVWRRSVDVAVELYKLTSTFPESEKFGITNQMRRAAVSIPSNIAEGSGRYHPKDFIHFLRIADGASAELETQLIISEKIGFAAETKQLQNEVVVIRRMLSAFIKSLGK